MKTDPGFIAALDQSGGSTLNALHAYEWLKPGRAVEVDGGIDATTAPLVVRADATVLVADSAIFSDREGVAAAMSRLRTALNEVEDETRTRRTLSSAKESAMQLGMIGLGRMGANMVRRLIAGGHQCVVFDRSRRRSRS
jgi:lactate dehydrogenase-like 2-hydroxyacid dehydrogenase